MKKISFAAFVFLVFFIIPLASAKDKEDKNLPVGMEVREVNKVKVVVPVGAKIRQEGSAVFVEDTREFIARRLSEIEDKILDLKEKDARLEEKDKIIIDKIEELKKILEVLKKNRIGTQ